MEKLLEKGILNIFSGYNWDKIEDLNDENNLKIKTNIIWIFQALCNNNVESKEMLEKGITRDMFLVACNPEYKIIRHLVICSFA